MNKYISSIAAVIYFLAISSDVSAGTGLGGGGAKQLQDIALSETMLSASKLARILDSSPKRNIENQGNDIKYAKLMESTDESPAGILIEVQPSDFDLVATDAANGKVFVYRDIPVRATAVDVEFKTVAMTVVEDPSLILVVKDAGSK